MAERKRYKREGFKCWGKAKELRATYYQSYFDAHKKGGLCVAGSGATCFSIPIGLGWDVYFLPGESYGASCAFNDKFSLQCLEACEKAGYAVDLCSYMLNYWGSAMINKMILADGTVVDGFPKPDFIFTYHACCSHAPWYRRIREIEGGDVPMFIYDCPGGHHSYPVKPSVIDYIVEQLLEAIPWMEKVTGRRFDDERMMEAINNEIELSDLWAEICSFQKAIPSPMSEKTAYSFHGLTALRPMDPRTVAFFRELKDEMKDRVERGIADVAGEQFRIITDSNPPWAFLELFRYMESVYGVVSLGSLYTFGLHAAWEIDEKGALVPARSPKELGMPMRTREEALRALVDHKLKFFQYFYHYAAEGKSELMKKIVKQWNANGVIIHLNRGCEGIAAGQLENRLALVEAGIPVLTYEGNMADPRVLDLVRTREKIDSFLEGLGVAKLT